VAILFTDLVGSTEATFQRGVTRDDIGVVVLKAGR
jgi:hypothetical protein